MATASKAASSCLPLGAVVVEENVCDKVTADSSMQAVPGLPPMRTDAASSGNDGGNVPLTFQQPPLLTMATTTDVQLQQALATAIPTTIYVQPEPAVPMTEFVPATGTTVPRTGHAPTGQPAWNACSRATASWAEQIRSAADLPPGDWPAPVQNVPPAAAAEPLEPPPGEWQPPRDPYARPEVEHAVPVGHHDPMNISQLILTSHSARRQWGPVGNNDQAMAQRGFVNPQVAVPWPSWDAQARSQQSRENSADGARYVVTTQGSWQEGQALGPTPVPGPTPAPAPVDTPSTASSTGGHVAKAASWWFTSHRPNDRAWGPS